MVGFYVFEGSFFQGGGGWEEIQLCNSLDQVRSAAEDYLRDGHWTFGPVSETVEITAYADDSAVAGGQLYRHTRIEVPGLTPITFDSRGVPDGGRPDPDGRFGHVDAASVWDSVEVINTLVEERFRDITVSIDWDAVAVPALDGPMLDDDAEIVLDSETGAYVVIDPEQLDDADYVAGVVTAIMKLDPATTEAAKEFLAELPELDDPDALSDGLTDVLEELDLCRHLEPGYNSVFD